MAAAVRPIALSLLLELKSAPLFAIATMSMVVSLFM